MKKKPSSDSGKKKARSKPTSKSKNQRGGFSSALARAWVVGKSLVWRTVAIGFVALLGYTAYLDITIRREFEGQKWALPAHLYTRPMELYLGQKFDASIVEAELRELGYVKADNVDRVGTYRLTASSLSLHQRAFRFWDEERPRQRIKLFVSNGRIDGINLLSPIGKTTSTEIVRLEPRLFGSVSPLQHEDRTLVRLEEVPQILIDALIAYEDRQYYSHFGLNFKGLARVAWHALTLSLIHI